MRRRSSPPLPSPFLFLFLHRRHLIGRRAGGGDGDLRAREEVEGVQDGPMVDDRADNLRVGGERGDEGRVVSTKGGRLRRSGNRWM